MSVFDEYPNILDIEVSEEHVEVGNKHFSSSTKTSAMNVISVSI